MVLAAWTGPFGGSILELVALTVKDTGQASAVVYVLSITGGREEASEKERHAQETPTGKSVGISEEMIGPR